MVNVAAALAVAAASGGAAYLMYRILRPPPELGEAVKITTLASAYPWPPRQGVPMRVRLYKPTTDAGFNWLHPDGVWWPMIYEVPNVQFVQFPRELCPSCGPESYMYYGPMPHQWYQQFRGYYRPDGTASLMPFSVTSNWADFDFTPLYSGRILALDVGWTTWWDPLIDGPYACSGWGTIL